MGPPLPNLRLVVTFLIRYVSSETTIGATDGKEDLNWKKYLKYECPKQRFLCSTIRFQEKSGFSNPYSHLLFCYAPHKSVGEQEILFVNLFRAAEKKYTKRGGMLQLCFNLQATSEYEKATQA